MCFCRYTGGGTLTGPAITALTSQSFTTAAGHRAGVPKIAVVVTDGKSNNPSQTAAAAQKARDAGESGVTYSYSYSTAVSERLNTASHTFVLVHMLAIVCKYRWIIKVKLW